MTALAVAVEPAVSADLMQIIVISIIVGLSVVAVISKVCPTWGSDCWEQPPTYDPDRDRQWDVVELDVTARTGLPGAGLPGLTVLETVDHSPCEAHLAGECARTICHCARTDGLPCPGAVEPGCDHPGVTTCDEHRPDVCEDCRIDRLDDRTAARFR